MEACRLSGATSARASDQHADRLQEALVMAGMVSLRNDLCVEFGDWWTFNWKTNVITLPKQELATCPEEEICWIILHESAHAALTRLHHILPGESLQRPEIQVLLNCVEDVRIENWLVERFPGSLKWRNVARQIAMRNDPRDPEAAEQENPAAGFLRGLMRFGDTGQLPAHLHPESRAALEEALPGLRAAFACVPPSSTVSEASVNSLYAAHPVSRCYTSIDNIEEASPFEKWVRILQASMWSHVLERVLPIFLKLVKRHGCPQPLHSRVVRVSHATNRGGRRRPGELKKALRQELVKGAEGRYLQTVQKYGEQIRSITDLLLRLLPNHRNLKHIRRCRTGDRLDLRVAAQFEVDRRLHDQLWMRRSRRSLPDPAFVFAMDGSESMRCDEKSVAAYESIVVMREACTRAGIPFSILLFNDVSEVLQGWEKLGDEKAGAGLSALLKPDGGTDIAGALKRAGDLLEGRRERHRFVFLMTDGDIPEEQVREVQERDKQLAGGDITVLAFGLGSEGEAISRLYPRAELVRDAEALPRAFANTLVRAVGEAA
jgi:Mg-chelatase subunit ChlD